MPYIRQTKRDEFWSIRDKGHNPPTTNGGELNYELTLKCIKHLKVNGLSYETINQIVGALENVKAEFYRRVAVPYENTKIIENDDVYPQDFI